MDKGIGFYRNIYLEWLEATAALCLETDDIAEIRAALDPILAPTVQSGRNRGRTLEILVNIWVRTGEDHPELRQEALDLYRTLPIEDRVWLHYGLTLLRYPFFRTTVVTIGQLSQHSETITSRDVKARLFASVGQVGSVENAVERVVFSLRNWGLLADTDRKTHYAPRRQQFTTRSLTLESWLLAVALTAHPAEEMPFSDLVRLPELFPFRLHLTSDDLRHSPRFEVHRQGLAWDMISLRTPHRQLAPASV